MITKIEELDRQIVESELGVTVVINDDQSQSSMFDLRVGPPDRARIAIECVRATDPPLRAVFGTLSKMPPMTGDFSAHWTIELHATARIKQLYSRLPRLLAELEAHGIDTTHAVRGVSWQQSYLLNELESLGVGFAFSRIGKSTKVTFLPPGGGGAVDELGESVPPWISDFLIKPANADVIKKLRNANADKREVFIRADHYGVPWLVLSYLTDDLIHLPANPPSLPMPIDGVWLVCGKSGVRWDGDKWRFVGKITPPGSTP